MDKRDAEIRFCDRIVEEVNVTHEELEKFRLEREKQFREKIAREQEENFRKRTSGVNDNKHKNMKKSNKRDVISLVLLGSAIFMLIAIGYEIWLLGDFAKISYVLLLSILIVLMIKSSFKIWYSSFWYRERCYRRLAEKKEWLDKGIISDKEFEIMKAKILKKILE